MDKFSEMTDEKLVRLYEEGNYEVFDVLLERNQQRLFTYIQFLVGDNDAANDLFQDTFVRAITALQNHNYTEGGAFYPWLVRIARNLILDRFRHQRCVRTVSHEWSDENTDQQGDLLNNPDLCEPNVETLMLVEQSYEDVRMLVERLPEAQREVVKMRYFLDMPFKDIARVTGVSINTALGRMHYALINLRRMAVQRDLYLAV